jgi:hypothetical protein
MKTVFSLSALLGLRDSLRKLDIRIPEPLISGQIFCPAFEWPKQDGNHSKTGPKILFSASVLFYVENCIAYQTIQKLDIFVRFSKSYTIQSLDRTFLLS